MQALLEPLGMRLRLVSEFCDEAAEETAPTFVENALLKARHAAAASGLPAIADDSGIEVEALNGRPGVYSARYASGNASDADNNARLLRDLAGVPPERRGARFVCVMAFLRQLKVGGIFARLCHRDGKAGYLADIPRTLRRLGERVGHAQAADAVASGIERDLADVRARASSRYIVFTMELLIWMARWSVSSS